MTELSELTARRDEILAKIREIEASCEGIENENNARRMQELNLEQEKLMVQKKEIQDELNAVQRRMNAVQERISSVNGEMMELSKTSIDRILDAIKEQRWYFFKNKTRVLFDRDTGLLWANLDYFPWYKDGDSECDYTYDEAIEIVRDYQADGFSEWVIPQFDDFEYMIIDKTFPFQEGSGLRINDNVCWYFDSAESRHLIYLDDRTVGYKSYSVSDFDYEHFTSDENDGCVLPCNDTLTRNTDYETIMFSDNPIYTERERLMLTLDLFVQNELLPVFDDAEVTELYKKIYFKKPALLKELQELQDEIEPLQNITLLSSEFDYTVLLAKYDMEAVNASIIQYYQAIQRWTDELMEKLDYYEQEMEGVIREFNLISLKLTKKYEDNPNLTDAENSLLSKRQQFLRKNLTLGMNSVKSKILAIKKQADDLEYRIDEIDNGENALYELALLEKEERASFSFITENTAKIIKNALLKIEFFQNNYDFVLHAVAVWEKWTDDYLIFKTARREALKSACEEDGIEEEIWQKWYADWQGIRFAVEEKVLPVIERGLKSAVPTVSETEVSVPEQIISALEEYKNGVDKFFLEERKGIYQKFVFQAGGELQDKFEAESELYKCTFSLQSALQEIIFNCSNAEDRIFILKWVNSLLDIQIDEILDFVADNDLQKISQTILSEFAALKKKNYDVYLTDAKAYGDEKSRREKEYNSLIFKMRKDLLK